MIRLEATYIFMLSVLCLVIQACNSWIESDEGFGLAFWASHNLVVETDLSVANEVLRCLQLHTRCMKRTVVVIKTVILGRMTMYFLRIIVF